MKAAISGSSGFIGSHLKEALLSRGYQVVPITRELLFTPEDLLKFFQKEKPEWVYHLAAYGNHSNQTDDAITVFSNVIGTFNMLSAAKQINCKAFVNISSSSVGLPYETFYTASKGGGERIVNAFVAKYNLPACSVRPFSVYGEGEADFRFIPTIIDSLSGFMKLDPSPKHDWIYVDDFIEGLLIVAAKIEKTRGKVVEIGTGVEHSNIEVVTALQRITGKVVQLEYVERMRPYDSKKWVADTSFMNSLGFTPTYSLEAGLNKTYGYYKQRTKA